MKWNILALEMKACQTKEGKAQFKWEEGFQMLHFQNEEFTLFHNHSLTKNYGGQ